MDLAQFALASPPVEVVAVGGVSDVGVRTADGGVAEDMDDATLREALLVQWVTWTPVEGH
jgi:hypothetical protein